MPYPYPGAPQYAPSWGTGAEQGLPQGALNMQNPDTLWALQHQSPGEQGRQYEGGPGQYGRTGHYNPVTGVTDYERSSDWGIGQQRTSGGGLAGWIDPVTGVQYYDPGLIMEQMKGAGGDGGWDMYGMSEFGGPQVSAPDAYGGGDWGRPEQLSTQQVIQSYRPIMESEIGEGFAQAGNRLGQSGF